MRAGAGVLAGVALVASVAGCGGSPTPHPDLQAAGSRSASASPGIVLGPALLRSRRMPAAGVRLPVPSADLSDLVRVRGDTIAALVDGGAFFGEVYPAISRDDGGDWRIDGPRFARSAACGSCTTNRLAVSSNGTVMAWGRRGAYVRTQSSSEGRWYAATFPTLVQQASVHGSHLIVQTYGSTTGGVQTVACGYISRDSGRTWHRLTTTP